MRLLICAIFFCLKTSAKFPQRKKAAARSALRPLYGLISPRGLVAVEEFEHVVGHFLLADEDGGDLTHEDAYTALLIVHHG